MQAFENPVTMNGSADMEGGGGSYKLAGGDLDRPLSMDFSNPGNQSNGLTFETGDSAETSSNPISKIGKQMMNSAVRSRPLLSLSSLSFLSHLSPLSHMSLLSLSSLSPVSLLSLFSSHISSLFWTGRDDEQGDAQEEFRQLRHAPGIYKTLWRLVDLL